MFRYSGGKIWDGLPVFLRTAEEFFLFKKIVLKHLKEELSYTKHWIVFLFYWSITIDHTAL